MSKKKPQAGGVTELHAATVIRLLDVESDRGCVLVGGAFLDELLTEFVSAHVQVAGKQRDRLFDSEGACGTFSRKIGLVRALGWVAPEVGTALDAVRTIRNEAAHFKSSFDFSLTPSDGAIRACDILAKRYRTRQHMPEPRPVFQILVLEIATWLNNATTEAKAAARAIPKLGGRIGDVVADAFQVMQDQGIDPSDVFPPDSGSRLGSSE